MLKKVMIICLALSFVFIGGIAFAGNGHGPGPAPNSGDGVPDGPGWPEPDFINSDSSIIIAECDGDGIPDRPQDGSGKQKGRG